MDVWLCYCVLFYHSLPPFFAVAGFLAEPSLFALKKESALNLKYTKRFIVVLYFNFFLSPPTDEDSHR